jgi:pimeloyl-ACP methyl ester carboxylesterase
LSEAAIASSFDVAKVAFRHSAVMKVGSDWEMLGMTDPISGVPLSWLEMPRRSGSNQRLAMRVRSGKGQPVVWLGGFRSDMDSTKAGAIDAWAEREGRPFIRFDYSAHGLTGGDFAEMTLSVWLEDALAVLAGLGDSKPVIVGSSMGGWITLLAVRERVRLGLPAPSGLVLIAPAVDFSEELMWKAFPEAIKAEILTKGVFFQPSPYGDPYPITKAFIEDGRKHLMFGAPIDPHASVHILQGMQDDAVPWAHAMKLVEHLPASDCNLTLIKDGDHRLSRPNDIQLLLSIIDRFQTHRD